MFNRRTFLASSMALGVATAARGQSSVPLEAVEDTAAPLLPDALAQYASQPSLNEIVTGLQPFGTEPPTDKEAQLAKQVLDKVPTATTPMNVAKYFLDVGAGVYGQELRPYITAWPVRWNPVIVEFFNATHTQPSGDTTAWCAAFMNYCLQKAATGKSLPPGSADPTLSAASRSFRSWSKAVNSAAGEKPKPGDIVVFRNKNSAALGHVGFVLIDEPSRILVFGGNQFEGSPVRHTINRKWLAKDGGVLAFHSYRTDPQLHA